MIFKISAEKIGERTWIAKYSDLGKFIKIGEK